MQISATTWPLMPLSGISLIHSRSFLVYLLKRSFSVYLQSSKFKPKVSIHIRRGTSLSLTQTLNWLRKARINTISGELIVETTDEKDDLFAQRPFVHSVDLFDTAGKLGKKKKLLAFVAFKSFKTVEIGIQFGIQFRIPFGIQFGLPVLPWKTVSFQSDNCVPVDLRRLASRNTFVRQEKRRTKR